MFFVLHPGKNSSDAHVCATLISRLDLGLDMGVTFVQGNF